MFWFLVLLLSYPAAVRKHANPLMHMFVCVINLYLFPAVNAVVCIVAGAVMVVFPSSLTEEEEALQKKYAKLKKKVRKLSHPLTTWQCIKYKTYKHVNV